MFITFEGIDGCGKSTQAKMLGRLMDDMLPVLTREPGGWDGAEPLRELVLSGGLADEWSELLLFLLDRSEHCARVIKPALARGWPVICERYQDSTLAYQCWGRGLPLQKALEISSCLSFPTPDVTVYFRTDPRTALGRVLSRGKPDAFENEGTSFLQKISDGYDALSAQDPERWLIIECGKKTPDEIFEILCGELRRRGVIS